MNILFDVDGSRGGAGVHHGWLWWWLLCGVFIIVV